MTAMNRNALRTLQALALVAAAGTLSACGGRDARASETQEAPATKVTVAKPLVSEVSEWSEHTGRATAAETVEVRARATGHLTKVAFREGDVVKKGDLLFVIDPRPYEAAVARARAEVARARFDRAFAEKETARTQKLFASNVIAERDLDVQSSSLEQLGARLQVAEAALRSAELDAEYAFVRAPITGRVGRVLVTTGNLVGPQLPTPLATIVSVDPLHVYVDVEESHALALARARNEQRTATAQVVFEGDDPKGREGVVDFIDNRVDPQTGTLPVRVVVRNEGGTLTPGLFGRVRLPEGAAHPAVLVEDRAIVSDQDRKHVWVVDAEDKVQYRAVKLGPIRDGLRVVREGITASDRIVVRGLQRVRPGAKVAPELAVMGAPAEQAHGGAR